MSRFALSCGIKTRDVCFGPRETGDKTRRDGVAADRHDNGNRGGRLFGCAHPRRSVGYDDVDVEANKLGDQIGEPIVFALRPSKLYDNVPTLDITEIAQTDPQSFHGACHFSELATCPC